MRSNYKPLSKYIRKVNTRNIDFKTTKLLGINIDKFFMPSVANIVGTDMSAYKIVQKSQFACNRMHVGRDYRLPVALSQESEDFLVSPAYDVFEVKDTEELLPEYLMMWFSRKEYDRNAWFYTDADVRGGLHWNALTEMDLPVPHIDKQREIVKEYNVLVDRIHLNHQLIKKLEETAQAIYKQWFVDFEFPDENGKPYRLNGGEMEFNEELEKDIPKGWKYKTLHQYCKKIFAGGTPSRTNPSYWNKKEVPWIKNGEIKNNIISSFEEYISKDGLSGSSAKLLPKYTVLLAMYCVSDVQVAFLVEEASTNQACCALISKNELESAFLFYSLKYSGGSLVSSANGSAQVNLSKDIISDYKILIPPDDLLHNDVFLRNLKFKENCTRETIILERTRELLLSKLATVNK